MPTWGRLVGDGIDALVRGAWLPLLGVAAPLVVLAMLGQAIATHGDRDADQAAEDEL
jgi:ABC-type dipeptide/oligopeptide/nickel transport system permease subunit